MAAAALIFAAAAPFSFWRTGMKEAIIVIGLFLLGDMRPCQGQVIRGVESQNKTYGESDQSQEANRYFPMQIGNSWTYYEIGIEEPLAPITIIDSIRINGDLCFYYGVDKSRAQILCSDSLDRIWEYKDNRKILWFDFTLTEQDSYHYIFDDTVLDYIVKASRNRLVQTDIGMLDSCIFFYFDDPDAVDEEYSYTFAPGIGLIETSTGMGIFHKLKSAIINGKVITSFKPEKAQIPRSSRLCQNYPNPFNPSTTISYELPNPGLVSVKVYGLTGRLVKVLLSGSQAAGAQSVTWDGTDFNGNAVAAGIYIYRIEFTGVDGKKYMQSKKMSLVK
jgi:hypothetical protein